MTATMRKYFLTLIDFRKPSNYPPIAGWAEIFADCYAGWTMIYAAYGLAALNQPSWTILMPLGTIIILMLLVVAATRKRLMWAYYASVALLAQPSIKFIRAHLDAPQLMLNHLNVSLVGSLLFSLAALVIFVMPSSLNWIKSRPNPKARTFEYYVLKGFVPIKIELDGLNNRYAAFAVNPNTEQLERLDHYIAVVENGQDITPISETSYESLLHQFIHAVREANEQRKRKLN